MVDVLCIGHAAYDITIPLDEYPIENKKYSISHTVECGGGPAANAAYLLSKWGIDAAYIGLLGNDVYGKKIIQEFDEVGTDVSLVKLEKKYPTPFSTIIVNVKNGSRTIINRKVPHDYITVNIFEMEKFHPKIILMDGHELKASIQAMKLFPEAITVLDAGSAKQGTLLLAKEVDYLICSERFALEICNIESLDNENDYEFCIKELRKLNNNQIVVTLGERGLIYEHDSYVKHLNAYENQVVDTTGAGDIFHGAFAYGLLKGYDLLENLKLSSISSSLSVAMLGGKTSIPELTSVIDILNSTK